METLLHDLCVTMGFCLPDEERQRLAAQPWKDADALTDAIFVAEGFDLTRVDQTLRRQVHARVAARFHTLIDPRIVQDIAPLLESLAELRVAVTAAQYDTKAFGNYSVRCEVDGAWFLIVRDRGIYEINAPAEQLKALDLFRGYDSRDDLHLAVLKYARALSATAPGAHRL